MDDFVIVRPFQEHGIGIGTDRGQVKVSVPSAVVPYVPRSTRTTTITPFGTPMDTKGQLAVPSAEFSSFSGGGGSRKQSSVYSKTHQVNKEEDKGFVETDRIDTPGLLASWPHKDPELLSQKLGLLESALSSKGSGFSPDSMTLEDAQSLLPALMDLWGQGRPYA